MSQVENSLLLAIDARVVRLVFVFWTDSEVRAEKESEEGWLHDPGGSGVIVDVVYGCSYPLRGSFLSFD